MQADLPQKISNPSRGPQASDEAFPALLAEVHITVAETMGLAVHFTRERHFRISTVAISPHKHELAPHKQVGEWIGIGVFHHDITEIEREVCEQRRADLGIEIRDLRLDILPGPHVIGCAAIVLSQRIEQDRVHFVADSKGEQTGVFCGGSRDMIDDCLCIRHALGRQPVGQEDDRLRTASTMLRQGIDERTLDIGSARGVDVLHEAQGIFPLGSRPQSSSVAAQSCTERDDVEPVLLVQTVEHELQRLFGLVQFLAAHAARHIQNKDNVLCHHSTLIDIDRRRHQHQEVTVFGFSWPVAHEIKTKILRRYSVVQREIRIRLDINVFITDSRVIVAAPVDGDIVAG